MANASNAKLVMTSRPTRISVQARDRRDAMFSPYGKLTQETFDVIVIGSPQQFIGSFKHDFAVPKHEKARVGYADRIVFGVENHFPGAIGGVFGCKRKSIAHSMRNENAGNALGIPQCD